MRQFKSLLIFILILGAQLNLYSQEVIKEDNYVLTYLDHSIKITFDKDKAPASLLAFDEQNQHPILIEKESDNNYVLNGLTPAEIIRLEYTFKSGKNAVLHTNHIANKSLSTGTITVYFNHPVDNSVMQIQNAVNLSNTLDDMLISYINACTSTMDIAIYNSASPSATTGIVGAINAAYARGVQVRVIYDGSTSSQMIPLLNSNIPRLASPTSSTYGIMHNKFVIFDANSTNANQPIVWTGSTNWTVAQIDGPDKNSAIIIQDQALAQGYKIEFEEMWGSTTMTPDAVNSKFGPNKIDNTPHNYIIGGKNVQSYFSPSDGANSRIIAAINTADSDIDVATMVVTRSDISSALISKYANGVSNTNLIIDSQNPSGNQISTLQSGLAANHAVVFNGNGIMHHKFMVVDNFNSASDPLVLVGSHNWSTSAETKNDENILIVHDLNIANQYYQAFSYLYQQYGGVLAVPNSEFNKAGLQIYPNPTSGLLTISSHSETPFEGLSLTVYDVLGNAVVQQNFQSFTSTQVDLNNEASGIYIVTVTTGNQTLHYKVIKE